MTHPLQSVLAGEHAAMWVLSFLGGRVSRSSSAALADAITLSYRTHRSRRDQLNLLIRDAGEEPVAAEVAYQAPAAATNDEIRAAALAVEQAGTALYGEAISTTSGPLRAWALRALADSAVRQLSFGGLPEPTPGL
ncbi:DUF4439 domain-containing protein [Nocardioides sp. Bht2]|uniref:DUF4439 domain-containing protein n=1 Tax=Nocardioides sp. Bht2 TaxID=3392297 RepID=UPI0039B44954